MNQYRSFVETVEEVISRKLTQEELKVICWLSGYEKDVVDCILGIIKDAHESKIRL